MQLQSQFVNKPNDRRKKKSTASELNRGGEKNDSSQRN